jgi:hypothetical protein
MPGVPALINSTTISTAADLLRAAQIIERTAR